MISWRTSADTTRSTRSQATVLETVSPRTKTSPTGLGLRDGIKTVKMRIPVLVSRSGFTAWGVELAQKAGLTLIGRARGKRFVALSGLERLVFDADPSQADDEDRRHARKSSRAEALD